MMFATDKATSLPDAQAAVETNLRTPEGKTYDGKIGNEFLQKHFDEVRQCKQAGKDDLRSFWFLLKFDKEGKVREVLLYPTTRLGACARSTSERHFPIAAPSRLLGQRISETESLRLSRDRYDNRLRGKRDRSVH
jgi:hypothetical protein